jgi:uncharacterized protein (TIRG00374 family)
MESELKPAGNSKRRWALILAIPLAAVFLYLAFRGVNWQEMLDTMVKANPLFLAAAFALLSLSCVMRGLRWRVLLSAEKLLPPVMVFWGVMTGYLGNAFLPARAGELVRVVLIGRRGGISKSFALATALTERLMDAILLVLISAGALLTMGTLPELLVPAMRLFAIAGAVGAVGILLAPRLGGLSEKIIMRLPLLPEGLRAKLKDGVASFLVGAAALQHWGRLGQFLLFSAAIWTLDMLTALQVARAFALDLGPALALVLLAALGLSSALPSTPGYVGVYQLVAVAVLTPFGFSQSEALVFILAYQVLNYAVISVWGLLGLANLRK